jgi:hypothetical protein
MSDDLLKDVEALAVSLEDSEEAEALIAAFWIASDAEYVPDTEETYKPFIYPH